MRESYRRNKHVLTDPSMQRNESIEIVFMYVGGHLKSRVVGPFDAVNTAVQKLIATISAK
jgi:hypothetical protein